MKNTYIKSPLNYIGGKHKLLPQIIPIFPSNINTFVDLFGGGFNVGINIKANKIIYNDTIEEVVDLLKNLYNTKTQECLNKIDKIIEEYNLSKTNKEGYLKLRQDYNNGNKSYYMFYSLICYAFNNQIRFNNKRKYNMPFGKDRSSFNPTLRDRFIIFVNQLHNKNIEFMNVDFKEFDISLLSKNDFVYCDPPYLISCATYNEKDGWNKTKEKDLLDFLDNLNLNNIKFALSNVITDKNKTNELLKEWSKKYNIYYLNNTYGNCNYHKLNKNNNITQEVLITNY